MQSLERISDLRAAVGVWRAAGERIAFVPTMGNLHAGHLALVAAAKKCADRVVVSIFVNPMQFDRADDLAAYPRTMAADQAALNAAGVDALFAPSVDEMYPRPLEKMSFVEVPALGQMLEGASRPGHFRGVTTVVNRLFNLVQPDIAIFGKKDYQQLLLIRRMVADTGMNIEIVGLDTVREADGLAMSSRNGYLGAKERAIAPKLYETIKWVRDQIIAGAQIDIVCDQGCARLEDAGFGPDYIAVREQSALAVPDSACGDGAFVVLASAWLGSARLIDNLEFDLNRLA